MALLGIWLMFLTTCGISIGQRLVGVPPEATKYIETGTTFSVACSPQNTSSSAVNLKWFGPNLYFPGSGEPHLIKDRSQMPVEQDGTFSRVYSTTRGTTLRLIVENVRDRDTGLYNCTGIVDNIPSSFSFSLLTIIGLTIDAPTNQFLVYGKTSMIQCTVTAQPAPEIDWYFNAVYIDPTADNSRYEINAGGLIVRNVTMADGGRYQCQGTHTTGNIQKVEIVVEVYTEPVLSADSPKNTSGNRFRDSQILCSADATPAPRYKWYLGTSSAPGRVITTETMGTRFRPSTENGDLTIVDIHLEDEQWYWCEAYNKAGTVRGKAYFEVRMIPVFLDWNNINMTTTKVGDTTVMTCQSEAKPNALMFFKREDRDNRFVNGYQPDDPRIFVFEKPSAPRFENQLIIPREVVIRISNSSVNDTGNYTCLAENSAGKNHTRMHIIIQHKPNFELMTLSLKRQCIWPQFKRNVTVFFSAYPPPSLIWAQGDGRTVSQGWNGYKMFLEPYWANNRPDEWMGNLEINWEVTSSGIDQIARPTGQYFPTATNNHGTIAFTITVEEALLPRRARNVNYTAFTAQSITLTADLPLEENCLPVIGFEVVFKIELDMELETTRQFTLEERHKMVLDNLNPGTSYRIYVYARNERGRSEEQANLAVRTAESTGPGVVNIISTSSVSPTSYLVVWRRPSTTGGLTIASYTVSWRKVTTNNWNSDDVRADFLTYQINDLAPGTNYEVKVNAKSTRGTSQDPPELHRFTTRSGPSEITARLMGLEVHMVVMIAVIGVIVILVAADMICFCICNFGVLACVYGSLSQNNKRPSRPIELDGTDSIQSSVSGDTGYHGQEKRSIIHNSRHYPTEEGNQGHEYINSSRLLSASKPAFSSNRNMNQPIPQPRKTVNSYREY